MHPPTGKWVEVRPVQQICEKALNLQRMQMTKMKQINKNHGSKGTSASQIQLSNVVSPCKQISE